MPVLWAVIFVIACSLLGCGSPGTGATPAISPVSATTSPQISPPASPRATLDLEFASLKATMLAVVDGLLSLEGARSHVDDDLYRETLAIILEADEEFWLDHGELVERYAVMEEYDQAVSAYVDAVIDDLDPAPALRRLERVRDRLASQ